MRKEGIRVPKGHVAASPEEAYKIAQQMQQGGDGNPIPHLRFPPPPHILFACWTSPDLLRSRSRCNC